MILATRNLKLRSDNGSEVEIPICIYLPEQTGDRAWSCKFEIEWPDYTSSLSAGGVDGMQALVLALQLIGTTIYASEYHGSGNLFYDRPGSGYGFPIAPPMRDMLIGDDAKYL